MNNHSEIKICIVSPDLIGPIKNGGIGTACFHLAKVLAENSFDVTMLFTGPLHCESHSHWEEFYADFGIKYRSLDGLKEERFSSTEVFQQTSYKVYQFLKMNSFNYVHFQEWQANGLVPLQAKETTNEFNDVIMTVTMHSSTQWQQDGMKAFNHHPLHDTKMKWAEEYCTKVCDLLIAPSNHMFEWALNSKWEITDNRKVLPYCYSDLSLKKFSGVDIKHLIFFGRLETRKGLEYFIQNVLEAKDHVDHISFLGKAGVAGGQNSVDYITENLKDSISYEVLTDLDSFQALDFIKQTKGLVVIPSLLDNYPYTILEVIQNKIPFLCSNAGGIPEMADSNFIFDINRKFGLCSLLKKIDSDLFINQNHLYRADESNSNWLSIHYSNSDPAQSVEISEEPLISICTPYYNYPKFLPYLLKSISELNYSNFEVIIVNDGSPDKEAEDVFLQMKNEYKEFHFYSKENSGVGDTRNFAASKANGEFLVFMDADNLATPEMLVDFVTAIQKTKADCVTCYFSAFDESYNGTCPGAVEYKYLPLGPAVEAGVIDNVFGDANFIVKKAVFDKLGGFGTERTSSWEDWEFLAKLNLNNFIQKVIPHSLFWYRHTEEGFSRITNLFNNRQRILKLYKSFYPSEIQKMMSELLVPYHVHKSSDLHSHQLKNNLNRVLANLVNSWLKQYNTVAVYGAGKHTKKILSLIESTCNKPLFILDDNPKVEFIEDTPVYSTDEERLSLVDAVIISSDTFYEQMSLKIETLAPGVTILNPYS